MGLFSQRGYNIEIPDGGPTEDPTLSRMTIVTMGMSGSLEQIQKQLHKLVDVQNWSISAKGSTSSGRSRWSRRAAGGARDELEAAGGHLPWPDRRRHPRALHGAARRDQRKLDAFIKTAAQTNEIIEVVRSGVCGIPADKSRVPDTAVCVWQSVAGPGDATASLREGEGGRP